MNNYYGPSLISHSTGPFYSIAMYLYGRIRLYLCASQYCNVFVWVALGASDCGRASTPWGAPDQPRLPSHHLCEPKFMPFFLYLCLYFYSNQPRLPIILPQLQMCPKVIRIIKVPLISKADHFILFPIEMRSSEMC